MLSHPEDALMLGRRSQRKQNNKPNTSKSNSCWFSLNTKNAIMRMSLPTSNKKTQTHRNTLELYWVGTTGTTAWVGKMGSDTDKINEIIFNQIISLLFTEWSWEINVFCNICHYQQRYNFFLLLIFCIALSIQGHPFP